MVRGTADVGATRDRHHVMERGDATAGAGERGRVSGMRVDDGACVIARLEDVAVKTPFARWATAAKPAAVELYERNVGGFEGFVSNARRTYEETQPITAHADVAGGAMGQPAARQVAARRNHRLAETHIRAWCIGSHSAFCRSG